MKTGATGMLFKKDKVEAMQLFLSKAMEAGMY